MDVKLDTRPDARDGVEPISMEYKEDDSCDDSDPEYQQGKINDCKCSNISIADYVAA